MPLSAIEIERLALEHGMIDPFVQRQKQYGVLSYGLDSYGYDIRVGAEYKKPNKLYFKDKPDVMIDPKNHMFNPGMATFVAGDGKIIVDARSFVQVSSVECFNMPANIQAYSHFGKSSYSRNGIFPLITPIDAGFKGFLTFAIVNCTDIPAVVYANEGIAQLSFWLCDETSFTYADKGGKYMNSEKNQGAIVKE